MQCCHQQVAHGDTLQSPVAKTNGGSESCCNLSRADLQDSGQETSQGASQPLPQSLLLPSFSVLICAKLLVPKAAHGVRGRTSDMILERGIRPTGM